MLGTRPELIRLSRIIPLLDEHCEHMLVHTGQNSEDTLSGLFMRELGIREPDVYMGVRGASFAEQVGQVLARSEHLFQQHQPDRLLVLGDTNSGLVWVVARRMGIPVYHMEAGNRCYDDRVPEEVNRRIIDHCSSVLMPYTGRSRANLLREGIESHRIYVTRNPIKEVMDHFALSSRLDDAAAGMGLSNGNYFLVTMHRAENVDIAWRLRSLVTALVRVREEYGYPVVCSLHPRTRSKTQAFGVPLEQAGVGFVEPLGFVGLLSLERSAFCVLTDSGTVQEEACILGVPAVTIRDVTERPETVECGSNVLSGCHPDQIMSLLRLVTTSPRTWRPPYEYLVQDVSRTVLRIVLGRRTPGLDEQARQERC